MYLWIVNLSAPSLQGGSKKKAFYYCNNFVYWQPSFTILQGKFYTILQGKMCYDASLYILQLLISYM